MRVLTLTGAYGRRYTDGWEVVRDWEAGLDFLVVGGDPGTPPYCSIRDLDKIKADGCTHIDFVQGSMSLLFVQLL